MLERGAAMWTDVKYKVLAVAGKLPPMEVPIAYYNLLVATESMDQGRFIRVIKRGGYFPPIWYGLAYMKPGHDLMYFWPVPLNYLWHWAFLLLNWWRYLTIRRLAFDQLRSIGRLKKIVAEQVARLEKEKERE